MKTINVLIVSENNYLVSGLSLYLKETFKNIYFLFLQVKPKTFYRYYASGSNMNHDFVFMDVIRMWPSELLIASETIIMDSKITNKKLKEVVTRTIQNKNKNNEITLPRFKLSKRELEFWSYLYEGDSDKKIGNKMKISIKTVSTHKRNIIIKLGLQNKNHLINLISKLKEKR